MDIETIILAIIGGGVFGFIGGVIRAKIDKPKIDADSKKAGADTIAVYQKIAYDAMAQVERINDELKEERKSRDEEKIGERKSREAERREIDKQFEGMQREILDMQILKGAMLNQITKLQTENIRKDEKIAQSDKDIAKIKKENLQLRALVIEHGGQIDKLQKKVTGSLVDKL